MGVVTEPLVSPATVRYIKLGESGRWEKECLEQRMIRIGFGSSRPDRLALAARSQWEGLTQTFIAEGKGKGTATSSARQLRHFFEDDGSTLWITIIGERLYWGFAEGEPKPHADGQGVWRPVRDGWRWTDRHGEPLTTDRLSGALTRLAGYRGTSCSVEKREYVVRRINGLKTPEVERAIAALSEMTAATLDLIQMLTWPDFEVLVDLLFNSSGWRRTSPLGGTQDTLDLELVLPITGERGFVQVKSQTTSQELAEYVARIEDRDYDRFFYVYHSGEARTDDEHVTVMGPDRLPKLVVDAGLVSWLIRKAS